MTKTNKDLLIVEKLIYDYLNCMIINNVLNEETEVDNNKKKLSTGKKLGIIGGSIGAGVGVGLTAAGILYKKNPKTVTQAGKLVRKYYGLPTDVYLKLVKKYHELLIKKYKEAYNKELRDINSKYKFNSEERSEAINKLKEKYRLELIKANSRTEKLINIHYKIVKNREKMRGEHETIHWAQSLHIKDPNQGFRNKKQLIPKDKKNITGNKIVDKRTRIILADLTTGKLKAKNIYSDDINDVFIYKNKIIVSTTPLERDTSNRKGPFVSSFDKNQSREEIINQLEQFNKHLGRTLPDGFRNSINKALDIIKKK